MTKTIEEEKNTIDLVTDAMFSASFLDYISLAIFNDKTNSVSLIDFYKEWLNETGATEFKIPFNLGSFTGYLFCGLLITKENWNDLLPNQAISTLGVEWGLSGVVCLSSKNIDINLPYFVKRVRNALGHTNFTVQVPSVTEIGGDLTKIHTLTKWTFKDINPNDPNDWFEVTLTMSQLEILIKKFQSIVHQNVRVK